MNDFPVALHNNMHIYGSTYARPQEYRLINNYIINIYVYYKFYCTHMKLKVRLKVRCYSTLAPVMSCCYELCNPPDVTVLAKFKALKLKIFFPA